METIQDSRSLSIAGLRSNIFYYQQLKKNNLEQSFPIHIFKLYYETLLEKSLRNV